VCVNIIIDYSFVSCLSLSKGELVRSRLVIDGSGLGLGTLRHLALLTTITSMGKTYFPETTASATIINAPWVFAKIYSFITPLLTPVRNWTHDE